MTSFIGSNQGGLSFPTLTGAAKLAGVIGCPIDHSKSPALHGYWLSKYQIDGAYIPMNVEPADLETALNGLRAAGFQGVNVTIPHKEAAALLCDHLSDRAKAVSAANTLVFQGDGLLYGDNTDGLGFIENIRQYAPQWQPDLGPVTILGAGGAARGIIDALIREGVKQVTIANRTEARARGLVDQLTQAAVASGSMLQTYRLDKIDEPEGPLSETALFINTTSVGMKGQSAFDLSFDALPKSALVTDIVYTPLETPFLAAARAQDLTCIDGLGMLLHQAVPGFNSWFCVKPEVDSGLRAHILAQ